jgi:hypothetical protein
MLGETGKDDRGRKTEGRRQRSEVLTAFAGETGETRCWARRGKTTEGRRQRSEVRDQRTEDSRQPWLEVGGALRSRLEAGVILDCRLEGGKTGSTGQIEY